MFGFWWSLNQGRQTQQTKICVPLTPSQMIPWTWAKTKSATHTCLRHGWDKFGREITNATKARRFHRQK
jgi:hypothetical protein